MMRYYTYLNVKYGYVNNHGYYKTQADHCVFVKKFEGGDFLILFLYVDDMLIVGRDQDKIRMLKKALNRTFAMKDLGAARQILGMHIIRDRSKKQLWTSQERYVTKVLQRFIQHVGSETGRFNTPNKLQIFR